MKLSKPDQEKLLDAVLTRESCSATPGERPSQHIPSDSGASQERPAGQVATPTQARKWKIDPTSAVVPLPAKGHRLTGLGAQHLGLGEERAQRAPEVKRKHYATFAVANDTWRLTEEYTL